MVESSLEKVVLHHAPNSRSSAPLTLLEELKAPYEVKSVDIRAGAQLEPAYLAVNPMGKVPAIEHRGQVVTELAAIFIYLADAFPAAGLAPKLDDPLRGPYLRWTVFYNACFEPALIDKALGREPGPRMQSPYGDLDLVMNAVRTQLQGKDYLLGAHFHALDILWGAAFNTVIETGLIESEPVFADYAARVAARDSVQRVRARDQAG